MERNTEQKEEKKANRAWAYKLIERHKAGEILDAIQLRLAYMAVGKPIESMKESEEKEAEEHIHDFCKPDAIFGMGG